MKIWIFLAVMLCSSAALASPTKKEATAFVKEVEAAVKANSTAVGGGPAAIRKHNDWYASLNKKRQAMFVDADACAFASDSARSLWSTALQFARRPNQTGYEFIVRREEDYRDNMKACKQSLRSLK